MISDDTLESNYDTQEDRKVSQCTEQIVYALMHGHVDYHIHVDARRSTASALLSQAAR